MEKKGTLLARYTSLLNDAAGEGYALLKEDGSIVLRGWFSRRQVTKIADLVNEYLETLVIYGPKYEGDGR